jgi:hypothetical protein
MPQRAVMVNSRLKIATCAHSPHSGTAKTREKYGVSNVNESFSKCFEFSENSRRIVFECAQKRE